MRFASKFDPVRNQRARLQQHPVPVLREILPSYQTHPRELRQSNPEIRLSFGFLSSALSASSCCLASNAPNHPQKRRKMLVFQASLQHVWPVFSYLHKSVPLGFVTIAHARDFAISPKMHRWLAPPREVIVQTLSVSARGRHCLIDEAGALHRVCFLFW
jgi:hypothetical protein